RLAGDAVDAVCQESRFIVHRRQAASHGPVFAARQRYVEDVVASASQAHKKGRPRAAFKEQKERE
ncbi:hypothetical protein V2I80_20425, partial [Pseudomonas viridiflava]|uniref:hypothetical protein n=2 Tax=Pseudomonas viridiflava TaxID=33069 RepID=UPI002ECB4262|nr:hypothetical protein [Pseudomonas viridiflava]MEE4047818.1 hypothetical protein [Pseudomonas viridiflava]